MSTTDVMTIRVLLTHCDDMDGVKAARCLARGGGVETVVCAATDGCVVRPSRHVHGFVCVVPAADAGAASDVARVARERACDVILPANMRGFHFLAENREQLSQAAALPPLASPDQLRLAENKCALSGRVGELAVPAPRGRVVFDVDDVEQLRQLRFPVLVKPPGSRGGRGIVKCDAFEYLIERLRSTAIDDAGVLVQEYIEGEDFTVGLMAENGRMLASTVQKSLVSDSRRFSHQYAMEFVEDEQCLSAAARVVEALNWSGMAYIDFRADRRDGTRYLLEINPRFGRALVGSCRAGVNFPYLMALRALGRPLPALVHRRIRYAHPKELLRALAATRRPHRSSVGWVLSDPGPELAAARRRLMKRFRGRRPAAGPEAPRGAADALEQDGAPSVPIEP